MQDFTDYFPLTNLTVSPSGQTCVAFCRGEYTVNLMLIFGSPSGPVPADKTWLDGDPEAAMMRLAHLVDGRIKARIASEVAAGKRKGK